MTLALSHSERAELERLRIEVAELRDEVAAWRANDEPDDDHDRWLKVKAIFGLTQAPARILLALIERPGNRVRRERLHELMEPARKCPDREPALKLVDVQIVKIRRALARDGYGAPVKNHWGAGWSIEADVARRLKAAIEAAQP